MNRDLYLNTLDAAQDVIYQLPKDVTICCIRDTYQNGKTGMLIQIIADNSIEPDRVDNERGWAEKDYDGLFGKSHAVITVGWCLPDEEDDDESAV